MFGFSQPDVPQIDATDVMGAITGGKDIILLDVRTPQEFSKGNIISSINIPVNEVAGKIEEKISDKNKTIYVYCLSGSRSVVAVAEMVKLGYKNVFSVTSGLLSWRAKKYPLSIQ